MDILERYRPPLVLTSDMLFMIGLAPGAPLAEAFPRVPFLKLNDRVPLAVWFSRVRTLEYGTGDGTRVLQTEEELGYNELTVLLLTRRRRLFVPGIYADSELSFSLGRRYGMPKELVAMSWSLSESRVSSRVHWSDGVSSAEVPLSRVGVSLARLGMMFGAWWTWPVDFPEGPPLRARILAMPGSRLGWGSATLELQEGWLPAPLPLLKPALFVPGLRMLLPAPGTGRRTR